MTYVFATPAQWAACLAAALPEDRVLATEDGVSVADAPPAPAAIVTDGEGGLLWVDADGAIRRDRCAGTRLPPRDGRLVRLVCESGTAWALLAGRTRTLVRIDSTSLQRLAERDAADILDIAPDGAGGLWALRATEILRLDAHGRRRGVVKLPTPGEALARAGTALFVLAESPPRLLRIDPGGGAPVTIDLDPGFAPTRLSGQSERLLIEGHWPDATGFLLVDAEGGIALRGRWAQPPRIVTLAPDGLIAWFAGSALRFAVQGGGRRWLTPALEGDTLASIWLRAEAIARLPEGATLQLRWAASRDEGLRAAIEAVAADETRSPAARIDAITTLLAPDWSEKTLTYAGVGPDPEAFAFPLYEARGHLLWLELRLHRNDAATAPDLARLTIRHDAPSLIDHLPAIYRCEAGDGDGTLRRLLGVIEATTQDLDARIAMLAERLAPDRCAATALQSLAELLGLPFHAGLSERMQRGLIGAAPAILLGRGTAEGLQAALEALLGPRAFRIVDTSERGIPIALGIGRLPALLSGPSARVPRLNARLVLNRTALRGADHDCSITPPAAEILVFVPVTPRERRAHGDAIGAVLAALIPAGVRLRLRWIVGAAATRPASAEVLAIPAERRPLRLGEGQALGGATLGGDRRPALRDGGIGIGHGLV